MFNLVRKEKRKEVSIDSEIELGESPWKLINVKGEPFEIPLKAKKVLIDTIKYKALRESCVWDMLMSERLQILEEYERFDDYIMDQRFEEIKLAVPKEVSYCDDIPYSVRVAGIKNMVTGQVIMRSKPMKLYEHDSINYTTSKGVQKVDAEDGGSKEIEKKVIAG